MSPDELLRSTDWGRLSVRLVRYAYACSRKGSLADAQNLAQDAIASVFEPSRPWDPEREPDLFAHLAKEVRRLAANRRRTRGARHMLPYEPDALDDVAHAESPQDAIERTERAVAILERVRARASARDDRAVLEVLELLEERVETTAEHAERLGCSFDEARNARRRLKFLVDAIEAELDAEVAHA